MGSIYEHVKNGKRVGYQGGLHGPHGKVAEASLCQRQDREEVRQKLAKGMEDRNGGRVCDAGSKAVGEYLTVGSRTA